MTNASAQVLPQFSPQSINPNSQRQTDSSHSKLNSGEISGLGSMEIVDVTPTHSRNKRKELTVQTNMVAAKLSP